MPREKDLIVGRDPALRQVLARALRAAPTRVPMLVTGESGTGKELLARLIHDHGPAPDGPFVAVNCGTLPRELADSELFGHERGAFTGAGTRRSGWFEEADGGTLVLDEIGELPLDLQPKLLRVLETGRLRRVGGRGEITVSARIVAMTLRDLRREIARGCFRADLYHRLAGFELALPPLRERPDDIPALVARFLDENEPELGPRTVDAEAARALVSYAWPGNVRELRNVVRRAAILSSDSIGVDALGLPATAFGAPGPHDDGDDGGPTPAPRDGDRDRLSDGIGPTIASASGFIRHDAPGAGVFVHQIASADREACDPTARRLVARGFAADELTAGDVLPLADRTFEQIERAVLAWALRRHGGNRRRAARALAVARSTFCDKVKRYQLV